MIAMDQREIARGVYGWLESPRPDDLSVDCVLVSGWTFARSSQVAELFVEISGRREPLPYGLRRDDVRAVYPEDSSASHCGFSAFFDVDNPSFRPVRLEVWATLEDGRTLRLFARHLGGRSLTNGARRLVSRARSHLAALQGSSHLGSAPVPGHAPRARQAVEDNARLILRTFLMSGAALRYQARRPPLVSIVVVLWNRAELTLRCLRAISEEPDLPVEVILVDNQSTDDTAALLAQISGATVLRNTSNLGFTVAANCGATAAQGDLLLFLNNDAELMPGALRRLVATIAADPTIGAVGGKLVFPGGRLQEAGSIIWSDGSCDAYGRFGDPDASEFNFQRDVDFCSGAFLLTRRRLFKELGGFDERYEPAYYEDVDYCVKLWQAGQRVVYQPAAVAIHFEFASSSSPAVAQRLQEERRAVFSDVHGSWLAGQYARTDGTSVARTRLRGRRSVLVVDDSWPEPHLGSGFPRAAALLRALVDLDYLVTVYPMAGGARRKAPSGRLAEIEVVGRNGPEHLRSFLGSRGDFGTVIISRPHNLQRVKVAIGSDLSRLGAPVIYDAEAVYALRTIGRMRVEGAHVSATEERALVEREVGLARGCTAVLTVNDIERLRFINAGVPNVAVLRHAIDLTPTDHDFASRWGLLFVGALASDSPNEDAVLFLVQQVLPALERATGQRLPLTIAGANVSDRVIALKADHISVLSNVVDLVPLYSSARVFVVPTRYSAGIPLKLYEAAAHGLPIVCTSELVTALGWQAGRDVMIGDQASELAAAIDRAHGSRLMWEHLREAALERVAEDCAPAAFRAQLRDVLSSLA
jgi:GT2 family glycosyltransferase